MRDYALRVRAWAENHRDLFIMFAVGSATVVSLNLGIAGDLVIIALVISITAALLRERSLSGFIAARKAEVETERYKAEAALQDLRLSYLKAETARLRTAMRPPDTRVGDAPAPGPGAVTGPDGERLFPVFVAEHERPVAYTDAEGNVVQYDPTPVKIETKEERP